MGNFAANILSNTFYCASMLRTGPFRTLFQLEGFTPQPYSPMGLMPSGGGKTARFYVSPTGPYGLGVYRLGGELFCVSSIFPCALLLLPYTYSLFLDTFLLSCTPLSFFYAVLLLCYAPSLFSRARLLLSCAPPQPLLIFLAVRSGYCVLSILDDSAHSARIGCWSKGSTYGSSDCPPCCFSSCPLFHPFHFYLLVISRP